MLWFSIKNARELSCRSDGQDEWLLYSIRLTLEQHKESRGADPEAVKNLTITLTPPKLNNSRPFASIDSTNCEEKAIYLIHS